MLEITLILLLHTTICYFVGVYVGRRSKQDKGEE